MLLKSLLVSFLLLLLLATAGLAKLAIDSQDMAVDLGLANGRLKACPESPNCVSSDVPAGNSHFIAPFADAAPDTWEKLQAVVAGMDGAELLQASENYLCYTFQTPMLKFKDDVEFHFRPTEGVIAVRSASRVGYSDWDTNRKRIEVIRSALTH